MSYRLKNDEPLHKGLRRIVLKQIDKAIDRLKSTRQPGMDEAIHDARVCLKKIRAVLRLVRPRLDGEFDRENEFYRDLGRKLSSVRNDAAMLESIDKLRERFSDQLSAGAFNELRKPFVQSKVHELGEKRRTIREVARTLHSAGRRAEAWPLQDVHFSDLSEGLRSVYKQGRQNFAAAARDPTVENLHEWRKRVKDLWYQTRLLKPSWPKAVGKLADELQKLGDYLSDDHDLALVRQRVAEIYHGGHHDQEPSPALEAFIALIDQRRAELQLEAELLGERVYAEKPKAFADRFQTYWEAWRKEVKTEPAAVTARKAS